MDKRICEMIKSIDEKEIEAVMNNEFDIDKEMINNIKIKTRKNIKDNEKNQKYFKNKLVYIMISMILVFFFVTSVGYDQVLMAVNKAFYLIPGVGAREDQNEIVYTILENDIFNDNEDYRITLQSAMFKSEYLQVSFLIESSSLETNVTKENLLKVASTPNVKLKYGEKEIDISNWSYGLGREAAIVSGFFEIEEIDDIEKEIFTLNFDQKIDIDFSLVPITRFASLDQVGDNVKLESLSIIAKSIVLDDSLKVTLYPYESGIYEVSSFVTDKYNPAQSMDLVLLSDGIKYEYEKQDKPHVGPLNQFVFKNFKQSENMKILIPNLELQSKEETKMKLPIPEKNEIAYIDKKISFKDSIINIKEVETVIKEDSNTNNSYLALRIKIEVENLDENMNFNWLYLSNEGQITGGFGWEYNEEGIADTYYYALDDLENKSIKMIFKDPKYIYSDEIELPIENID